MRLGPIRLVLPLLLLGLLVGVGVGLSFLARTSNACDNGGVTTAWQMHIVETENVQGTEFSMHLELKAVPEGNHIRRLEFLNSENVNFPPLPEDMKKESKEGFDSILYPFEPIRLNEASMLTYRAVTECGEHQETLKFTANRHIQQTYECDVVVRDQGGQPHLDADGNEMIVRVTSHFSNTKVLTEEERQRHFCWLTPRP